MATVQLELEGMTCAACAARIDKALNKLDGVEASVNYATERATATPRWISVEDVVARSKPSATRPRSPHRQQHQPRATTSEKATCTFASCATG